MQKTLIGVQIML